MKKEIVIINIHYYLTKFIMLVITGFNHWLIAREVHLE